MRWEQTDDDDFVGFAIVADLDDAADPTADFLLIDWKQADQTAFGGLLAPAGLAVSRVQGDVDRRSRSVGPHRHGD